MSCLSVYRFPRLLLTLCETDPPLWRAGLHGLPPSPLTAGQFSFPVKDDMMASDEDLLWQLFMTSLILVRRLDGKLLAASCAVNVTLWLFGVENSETFIVISSNKQVISAIRWL